MKSTLPAGFVFLLLGSLLGGLGCERESDIKPRPLVIPPAPSGEQLDGMQLASARRVALESTSAAMKRRDLQRLKQLSTWVRHRAQSSLFEPDDLAALDLAIECLEHGAAPTDQLARVEALKTGTLRTPAREVCLGHREP